MNDTVRRDLTTRLQIEADSIAHAATEHLAATWSNRLASSVTQQGGNASLGGLGRDSGGPRSPDEATAMMEDGLRRLGKVIAFGVLVDEPGVIVDDLNWLTQMFGARHIDPGVDGWQAVLLQSYLQACSDVVSEDEQRIVRSVVDRAIRLLRA